MTKKIRFFNDTGEPITLEPGQSADIKVDEEQRRLQSARSTLLHLVEVEKMWEDDDG